MIRILTFFRNLIFNKRFSIYIPIPGLGCGVLGMVLKKVEVDLGKIATNLLKALEYRGYDSTGAAVQDDKGKVILKKDVGAPSEITHILGIDKLKGKIFCGQVRWATFGVVDQKNAQPHVVRCHTYLYGAHNGNITNTHRLKEFLLQSGHQISSDNDGEMLVHMVEHYFHIELDKLGHPEKASARTKAMRNAILKISEIVEGSYAAVIVDPVTEIIYGIKSGSSLYAGMGEYNGNPFALISSDLTALLRYTKHLIPLQENQFVECSYHQFRVFALKDHQVINKDLTRSVIKKGQEIHVELYRSKLRVEDTSLKPPFKYFMEQEIYASILSSQKLIDFLEGGSPLQKKLIQIIKQHVQPDEIYARIVDLVRAPYETQKNLFQQICDEEAIQKIIRHFHQEFPDLYETIEREENKEREFSSKYSSLLLDISEESTGKGDPTGLIVAKILDSVAFNREYEKFYQFVERFSDLLFQAWKNKCGIYTVSCGTSYNASKTAALFFNEIAGIEIVPILPGNFRGQYSNTLRDGDVVIGISQSGETKDLIDIFNDIIASGKDIRRIAIVNNENSTLAQEKSEFYLPIKCGPEIAVPATKSYMNQVVLFYFLALRIGRKVMENIPEKSHIKEDLDRKWENMHKIPDLLKQTIKKTARKIEEVAEDLYLKPSIHILATKIASVAEEGALKIRETVLNHTQGIEGSEFKHGPNTILGKNTVLGTDEIKSFITQVIRGIVESNMFTNHDLPIDEKKKILSNLPEYIFDRLEPFNLTSDGQTIFRQIVEKISLENIIQKNYPLIFLTGPEERDVKLTISQINTHKIRGADVYIIAEPNEALLENAGSIPDGNRNYKWNYIELPRTDDTLLSTFSSIIVLQLLAFKMSVKKMKYLNKIKIPLHGVHPDVPKNVSKSITVD
jgi:glucosamine 6-phosphate synthetase-like amidotransferase/phosphosugar isomerase protein